MVVFLQQPVFTNGQILSETVISKNFISDRKHLDVEIIITGSLYADNKVAINFRPIFREDAKVLNEKTLKKYKVSFELFTEQIIVEPFNTFIPASGDKRIENFFTPFDLVFHPKDPNASLSEFKFVFPFHLVLNKKEKEWKATMAFKLHDQTITDIGSQIDTKEAKPVDRKDKQPVSGTKSTDPKLLTQETGQSASEGGSGPGEEDDGRVKALRMQADKLLVGSEELFNQIQLLREESQDKPPSKTVIMSFHDQLRDLRTRFDIQTGNVDFMLLPDHQAISALFNDYHGKAQGILNQLLVETEAGSDAEISKIEKAEKHNKLLRTFLWILGFILFIMIAVIAMVYLQKKMKLNFQKKMQRKAKMELQKQKNQVLRPKNKVRI